MEEVRKFTAKNGEEITLRPAQADDAGQIIATVRSSSSERSYVLMEYYGKDAEAVKKSISGIDRQKNLLLVAVAKEQVIGSLAALQADGGERPETAHVVNVGLHLIEAYRGMGIGCHMLEYANEWAEEHGFKKLEADIFTDNQRSLHLFSRAGYVQECVKRKRIRIGRDYIDEVCMGKLLE